MTVGIPALRSETVAHRLRGWARRILYWALPPGLLYVVFRRVDPRQAASLASAASPWLMAVGVLLVGLVVLAGALRWHLLLRRYVQPSPSLAPSVAEYWRSLAVGLLAPGTLGADAYRVVAVGRQSGRYLRSAFVIGVEKVAALVSCALLVVGLYPFLSAYHLPASVIALVRLLYVASVVALLLVVPLLVVREQGWVQRLAKAFNRRVETLARTVAPRSLPASTDDGLPQAPESSAAALMASMFSAKVGVPAVALSLAVHVLSALQAQVFFTAVGHHVPFAVNLFVTPLLFLLLMLPISFAGIGVRESAYVVLYGAFGVSADAALVVSFAGWFSALLANALGAVLLLSKNRGRG